MMILETYYDGTNAVWVWNNIRKRFSLEINMALIPGFEKAWVIKNYSDYMVHFNTLRWKKGRHYASKKKLDGFKENLKKEFHNQDVDPIEYLIYLYYQCWLSIDDIWERVNELGLTYKDPTWLRVFVTKTFNWTLRENTEKTEQRIRKEKTGWKEKRVTSLREFNKPRIEEQTQKIREAIDTLIGEWKDFNKEVYNSLSNNTKKCIYLFECFLWIWGKEIAGLFSVVDNQNIITTLLQTKLNTIFATHGITPFPIYARTVSEIKKQSSM